MYSNTRLKPSSGSSFYLAYVKKLKYKICLKIPAATFPILHKGKLSKYLYIQQLHFQIKLFSPGNTFKVN
jgi:hypothetical protein